MSDPELSIVLPVYNEGLSIESVLRRLEGCVDTPHETLIVYDFDEDDTIPVVNRLRAEFGGLQLVRNHDRGVLAAMRTGISVARGQFVLVTMADGSDDPETIDRMVDEARAGAAMVVGSRYMPGGRQVGAPFFKQALSRSAGLTLHWFAGLPVHDATNNFRLYDRSFLDSVTVESVAGFELGLELTAKAYAAGLPMAEVPTLWQERTAGTSKFKLRAWLPHYIKWYVQAFSVGMRRRF